MNFRVTKTIEFCAGHRVLRHESKCRNPHGHHYSVAATIEGPLGDEGSQTGMVVDFSHIKRLLTELVHDRWDHGFIVEDDDPLGPLLTQFDSSWRVDIVPFTPTAENLAAAVMMLLSKALVDVMPDARVVSVCVRETPTSVAEVFA